MSKEEWITIHAPLTADELERYAGERCPDYEPGCATCDAWRQFDAGRMIEIKVERKEFMRMLVDDGVFDMRVPAGVVVVYPEMKEIEVQQAELRG